jgi:hypothetical protein
MRTFPAILLLAGSIGAQSPVGDPMSEVRAIEARPGYTWTENEVKKVVAVRNNAILDLVFQSKVFADHPALRRPEVVVELTNRPDPPHILNGKIYLSVEYSRLLEKLSYLLSHDIYTRGDNLQVPHPLLDQPAASGALLPLMQPFRDQLEEANFAALVDVIHCPKSGDKCDAIRNVTYAFVNMFVLAHETAHAYYGDTGGETAYPTDTEIRADRKAWEVLTTLRNTVIPGTDRELSLALSTSALLPISYQKQLLEGRAIASDFEKRLTALSALMPADTAKTAARMVTPQRTPDPSGLIVIAWREQPDLLIVNGVRVDPAEVAGRSLLVPGKSLTSIFARKGSRFAFSGVYARPERTESASLVFEDLKPTPANVPDDTDFNSDQPGRDWFEVFLRTSNGQMQAREPRLAMRHWEALAELHLNEFLPVQPGIPLKRSETSRLNEWRDEAKPLQSWRTPQ